ncbi:hypothetical protein GCM10023074_60070 [Microbispora amethystogenes]|uniref:Uncharacterized protein n=1 Tax=Microbispora amethystogenes TaxID=1427754 RepID=A0ABQ4FN42_9ACTN|nr:hypothetical protein Mam01_64080 [Microbispora amethystogenes]
MLTALSRWQRVALVAVLTIPLLAIIILTLPTWLVLPFRREGREFILELVERLTDCLKAFVGVPQSDQEDGNQMGRRRGKGRG